MNVVATLTILILCLQKYIRCDVNEITDYVTADVEILPPFETIIFSDLFDVVNEFNNNLKSGFDSNVYNDVEEKKSIDDLVSNYQNVLDRKYKLRKKEKVFDLNRYSKTHSKYGLEDLEFPPKLYPFLTDSFYPYKNNRLPHTKTTEDQAYLKDEANNELNKDNLNININVELKMDDFIETLTSILTKIFDSDGREDSFGATYKNNPFLNFLPMRHLHANKSYGIMPDKKVSLYKKKNRHSKKVGRGRKNKSHLLVNRLDSNTLFETSLKIDKNNLSPRNKNIINTEKKTIYKNFNSSFNILQNNGTNKTVNVHNVTAVNENKTENSNSSSENRPSYMIIGNNTEDFQSLGNSIEKFDVATTEPPKLRRRRQTKPVNLEVTEDYKLLYWPPYNSSNNLITTSVGDLPIQKEQIELNTTNNKILSKVNASIDEKIFNETNWKDINAIARKFVYFVGKHLNGMFTLCSEDVCHSINCANKSCHERVCEPQERFNAKGHCTAKLNTDTTVPVSVISVPSSKAFKLIEDLKSKVGGSFFGKATLCQIQKCVTFVATEKAFMKSDCTSKELSAKGHCIHKMM